MKERVEDLGRIYILLRDLRWHELFYVIEGRTKDFEDSFYNKSIEEQKEILHKIAYGVENVKHLLNECIDIASGEENEK